MSKQVFTTPLTKLLKIQHPIMAAGMGAITYAELVAAVSNEGGIGSLGAVGLSPDGLRTEIRKCKALLNPGVPFGVDLLLPQSPKENPNARKTNKDYTQGQLGELVQVMIDEKVPLFVCAVGVPPRWVCDKLHEHGIVVMNMIGAPKHAKKAIAAGCDIICAQGTEAGGHTGDISSLVLIPQVVDLVKGVKNYFGMQIPVVGAGGIFDGRGLAACLALGASGVWVGTRFLTTPEASAEKQYKELLLKATSAQTTRTLIFTGRPLRVVKNKAFKRWSKKPAEATKLLKSGVVPMMQDFSDGNVNPAIFANWAPGPPVDRRALDEVWDNDESAALAGQCVGAIKSLVPAADIVNSMISEAEAIFKGSKDMLKSSL